MLGSFVMRGASSLGRSFSRPFCASVNGDSRQSEMEKNMSADVASEESNTKSESNKVCTR